MVSEIRYQLVRQVSCEKNHLYYHLSLAFRDPKRQHRSQKKKTTAQVRSTVMQCGKKMEVCNMSKKQRY